MEFTGQAAIDFKKWYLKKTKYDFSLNYIHLCNEVKKYFHNLKMLYAFNCSPESMQFGVRQDWLDSVGIIIEINHCIHGFDFFMYYDDKIKNYRDYYNTRPQARTAAIHKGDELYNAQTPSTT